MTDSSTTPHPETRSIGIVDALRFLCEIFAVVSLAIWGFTAWSFPLSVVFGLGLPIVAILLWALFRSPRAVIHADPFVKAIVEIVVMATAAYGWLDMHQPIVAGVFAVVALVTGLITGRREI